MFSYSTLQKPLLLIFLVKTYLCRLEQLLKLPQTELAQRLVTASLQLEERSCCIALLQESLANHKEQVNSDLLFCFVLKRKFYNTILFITQNIHINDTIDGFIAEPPNFFHPKHIKKHKQRMQ